MKVARHFLLRLWAVLPALAILGFSAGPAASQAMAAQPAAKQPAVKKPVKKPVKQAVPQRAEAKPTGKQAADLAQSRVELRSKASQMAAGFMAAEAALSPDELAIADQVHTGVLPCELGAVITLENDPGMPGYFNMSGKNFRFRMVPVVSTTGAIRLEDRRAGVVWLQLANKSMLMNQTAGRRMADDCMSPAQASLSQQMKLNPGPGLLDRPSPASDPADLPSLTRRSP